MAAADGVLVGCSEAGRAAAKTARHVASASSSDMAAVSSLIVSSERLHASNPIPARTVAQSP